MAAASTSSELTRQLLRRAVTYVPQYSFTRPALRRALEETSTSLSATSGEQPAGPSSRPEISELEWSKKESLLETLFGNGLGPEKALVREWEHQGLQSMEVSPASVGVKPSNRSVAAADRPEVKVDHLRRILEKRLRWTNDTAGEHVVEAYALLASSEFNSISLPKTLEPLFNELRRAFQPLPSYVPPTLGQSHSSSSHLPPPSASTSPHLPIPGVHVLPLLGYGMRIADRAVHTSQQSLGLVEGGASDWYIRRLALAMIYLHAESHLLHPRAAGLDLAAGDPRLAAALDQLNASLGRYRLLLQASERFGGLTEELGHFGSFVWKSWGGLFRSRGWIR